MKSEILEFYSKAVEDEKLAKRLQELLRNNVGSDSKEIIKEVLLPYSKELGYNFSEDDFLETLTKKLSPEDLEQVSGGFLGWGSWLLSSLASIVGFGANTDVPPPQPQPVVIEQQQNVQAAGQVNNEADPLTVNNQGNNQHQGVIDQQQQQQQDQQQQQQQNVQATEQVNNEADPLTVNNQGNNQHQGVIDKQQQQQQDQQQQQQQNVQATEQVNNEADPLTVNNQGNNQPNIVIEQQQEQNGQADHSRDESISLSGDEDEVDEFAYIYDLEEDDFFDENYYKEEVTQQKTNEIIETDNDSSDETLIVDGQGNNQHQGVIDQQQQQQQQQQQDQQQQQQQNVQEDHSSDESSSSSDDEDEEDDSSDENEEDNDSSDETLLDKKLEVLSRNTIFIDCNDERFTSSYINKDYKDSVPTQNYANALNIYPSTGAFEITTFSKRYGKTEIRDLCDNLFNELEQNGKKMTQNNELEQNGKKMTQNNELEQKEKTMTWTLYNHETDLYEEVNIKYMDAFILYLIEVIQNPTYKKPKSTFENVEILLPDYFDANKIAIIKNNLRIINKFFPEIKSIDVQNGGKFMAEKIAIRKTPITNAKNANVATLDIGPNHSTLNIFEIGDKERDGDKIAKYDGAKILAKYKINFGHKNIRDKLKNLILKKIEEKLKDKYNKEEDKIKINLDKNETNIEKKEDKIQIILDKNETDIEHVVDDIMNDAKEEFKTSLKKQIDLESDNEGKDEIKVNIEIKPYELEAEFQEEIQSFKKKILQKLNKFNGKINLIGSYQNAPRFIDQGIIIEIKEEKGIDEIFNFLQSDSRILGAYYVFQDLFIQRDCSDDISKAAIKRLKLAPIDITGPAQNSPQDFKVVEMLVNNNKSQREKSSIFNKYTGKIQFLKKFCQDKILRIDKLVKELYSEKSLRYTELLEKMINTLTDIYSQAKSNEDFKQRLEKLENDLKELVELNKKVSTARKNQKESPNDENKINELIKNIYIFKEEAAKLDSFSDLYGINFKKAESILKIAKMLKKDNINVSYLFTKIDPTKNEKAGTFSLVNNYTNDELDYIYTFLINFDNTYRYIKAHVPELLPTFRRVMSPQNENEDQKSFIEGYINIYNYDITEKLNEIIKKGGTIIEINNKKFYDESPNNSENSSDNEIIINSYKNQVNENNNDSSSDNEFEIKIGTRKKQANKSNNDSSSDNEFEIKIGTRKKQANKNRHLKKSIANSMLETVEILKKCKINVSYLFDHGEKITLKSLLKYDTERLYDINNSLNNIIDMYGDLNEHIDQISSERQTQIFLELNKPEGDKEKYLKDLLDQIELN